MKGYLKISEVAKKWGIKERRIKRALFVILNDDAEVERLYKIIEKQEES